MLDRERESRLEREVWRLAREKREIAAPPGEPLRGEQIGMIEHEIRTAVTAVRGYLRWLGGERDRLLDPEHWSFVREARRAIERVAPLLDNLLELARAGRSVAEHAQATALARGDRARGPHREARCSRSAA